MIKVNIATAKGFNPGELKKVEVAKQVLNKILNNEKFRDGVLKFTTDGLFRFHYRRSFLGNYIDKPYTNKQVYEIITQNSGEDEIKQVDLNLELLPGGDVDDLGYTNPDTKRIYTHRNWFNNLTLPEYVGHLTHEWCHQLGFNHSNRLAQHVESSVPFGVGSITENITMDY